MANDNRGYVLLNRNITDNWIFQKPLYFHWFMYILLKANFKDNDKFMYNGDFMTVKRGEHITSYRKLASELPSCSEQKIRTFLKLLEKSKTIEVKSTHGATRISILNYDSYQSNQHTEQQDSNTGSTQDQHRSNNNRNNDKKDKPLNNDNINYLEIKNIFNSMCIKLPKIRSITDTRKNLLKARIKETSLETIGELFTKVSESDFLNGKNDKNWCASFDWILNSSNFNKILEGNYKNKSNETTRNGTKKGATDQEIGAILSKNFGHLTVS